MVHAHMCAIVQTDTGHSLYLLNYIRICVELGPQKHLITQVMDRVTHLNLRTKQK